MSLVNISTSATIKGAIRKETAWDIISDFAQYPTIMENVNEVNSIENTDTHGKSEWFVTIDGAPLRWVEKDCFNKNDNEINFESITGDFDKIEGQWKIKNYNYEGIEVSLNINYNLGIPVIEEVLGDILKKKMISNIDSMISAIKTKCIKNQKELRKNRRIHVDSNFTIIFDGKKVPIHIVNISSEGIMFNFDKKLDLVNTSVKIGLYTFESKLHMDDLNKKNYRLTFDKRLSNLKLQNILNIISQKHSQVQDILLFEKQENLYLKNT